jgi:hypothetical protein
MELRKAEAAVCQAEQALRDLGFGAHPPFDFPNGVAWPTDILGGITAIREVIGELRADGTADGCPARLYAGPDPDTTKPRERRTFEPQIATLDHAIRLVRAAARQPKVPRGAMSATDNRADTPLPAFLWSWREILTALKLENHRGNQRNVANANKKFKGPIILGGRGKQPTAEKAALLTWWRGLEEHARELEEHKRNTKATMADQYQYGKGATVVPKISGSVKNRRSDFGR